MHLSMFNYLISFLKFQDSRTSDIRTPELRTDLSATHMGVVLWGGSGHCSLKQRWGMGVVSWGQVPLLFPLLLFCERQAAQGFLCLACRGKEGSVVLMPRPWNVSSSLGPFSCNQGLGDKRRGWDGPSSPAGWGRVASPAHCVLGPSADHLPLLCVLGPLHGHHPVSYTTVSACSGIGQGVWGGVGEMGEADWGGGLGLAFFSA